VVSVAATPPATGSQTRTIMLLDVGASYGVVDKLQVGIDYLFALKEFEIKGTIGLHGAYSLLRNDKMDLAVAAALLLSVQQDNTVSLWLGGWFRYKVMPNLDVHTGRPGQVANALVNQLSINLNNGNAVLLRLPVGVGFQANPNLYAYAETTIAD